MFVSDLVTVVWALPGLGSEDRESQRNFIIYYHICNASVAMLEKI